MFATVLTDQITAFGVISVPIGAFGVFILSALIDKKNSQLLKDINGTYVRTKEFMTYQGRVEDHFNFLRDQIEPLRKECPLLHMQQSSEKARSATG
jgi:hypothetical protein